LDIVPASISVEHVDLETEGLRDTLLNVHLMDKDIALIDVSTGLSSESKSTIDMCDELVLVTHPELPTLSDALRTKELATRFKKKFLGVVLNRVKAHEMSKSGNVSSFLDLPVIGMIVEDHRIKDSINFKVPLLLKHPTSWNSHQFRNIAAKIVGKEREFKAGFFERLRHAVNINLK